MARSADWGMTKQVVFDIQQVKSKRGSYLRCIALSHVLQDAKLRTQLQGKGSTSPYEQL